MLFRHGLTYLWARGLPSIINFAAIALFTRLLTPDEFGLYAMVIASVFLVNAVIFVWLRLSLLRFAGSAKNQSQLLSTVLACFLVLVGLNAILALIVLPFVADGSQRNLMLFGMLLLWLTAWLDLTSDFLRAQLQPQRYGYVNLLKSVTSISVGGALAYLGWGAWGLLVGLALATALPILVYGHKIWTGIHLRHVDKELIQRLLRYGLPLTASVACSLVVRGSDRILLGWLLNSSVVGVYAAGYDLAQNSLEALIMIIDGAAFPLAVHALEQDGVQAAQRQLSQNITMLLTVALPAALGLAMVAPNLAHVVLGSQFQIEAAHLIPWVALAVLLSGIRTYYIDHAFLLGKNTMAQLLVLGLAAAVNVVLNLIWIPTHGILGAAWATVIAYLVSFVVGVLLARRSFPLPFPAKELIKVAGATAGMGLALWPLYTLDGITGLLLQILAGIIVYGLLLFALNGSQIRIKLLIKLRGRSV
jgi:O-antigen/teichoic acid export membrane protein